jgi:hypothetical protein
VIGRKELPAHLAAPYQAFLAVLEEVEPAKAVLSDVLPGTRLPGRPLRDAVGEFRDRLVRAQGVMAGWRCPEVESQWDACVGGLQKGIDRADRLLASPQDPTGFAGLLGTVEQLLDPLDPFIAAAERFRTLRRRTRRTD